MSWAYAIIIVCEFIVTLFGIRLYSYFHLFPDFIDKDLTSSHVVKTVPLPFYNMHTFIFTLL